MNIAEMENGRVYLQSFPRRVVLELTNTCNLNCKMCGRRHAPFVPTSLDFRVIEWLSPLFDHVEEVTLMGWGEPTLYSEFEKSLQFLDKYNVRKYFCTNGMLLDQIQDAIFDNHVDIMAVSINGTTPKTNDSMRSGSRMEAIIHSLKRIVARRKIENIEWPYLSFVYCLMKSNLHELPPALELASSIGLNRVKVVYFTSFSQEMENETLWRSASDLRGVFEVCLELAEKNGIELGLPYIPGSDPASNKSHKDCFAVWRDLYIGSDGFLRPCMSTSDKLLKLDLNLDFLRSGIHRNTRNIEKLLTIAKRCHSPVEPAITHLFAIGISKSRLYNRTMLFLLYGKEISEKEKDEKDKHFTSICTSNG